MNIYFYIPEIDDGFTSRAFFFTNLSAAKRQWNRDLAEGIEPEAIETRDVIKLLEEFQDRIINCETEIDRLERLLEDNNIDHDKKPESGF